MTRLMRRIVSRGAWIAASAVGLLMLPVRAVAQTAEGQTIVPAIYSSVPMTRNADLTFGATVLTTSAVDRALDSTWLRRLPEQSGAARLARTAKLVLFDIPVVWYAIGINHELGHIARADEQGFRSSFAIVGGPWSTRQFRLEALDGEIFYDFGSQAGGVEASRRLKDVGEDWMRGAARIAPGHALVTILASLDLPLYGLVNLTPGRFDPTLPRGGSPEGDAAQFVLIMGDRLGRTGPGDLDTLRRQVRARSALNFADAALWTLAYGLLRDHVLHGEEGVRVRWFQLGPLGVIPSVRYEWSPAGPEYYVRSHYRLSGLTGLAYVRWSDRLGDERLMGMGYSVAGGRVRGITPRLELDLWSHTTDGMGLHVASTAERPGWPIRAAALSLSAGAKSPGHLAAHPLRGGAYVHAGVVFRVW